MAKKSGAKYNPGKKEEIELAIINCHQNGIKTGDICKNLTEVGFKSPDGSELKKSSISTIFYRLRDQERLGEPDLFDVEPETETETEIELETECDQMVYDCLISETLSNNQKVGMLRGYYGI